MASWSSIYRKTPKGRFSRQKDHAKNRGIDWELSFEEWWEIWEASGKYAQRGRGKGKYCMCRYGDTGSYSKDNFYIDEWCNNIKEQHKNNPDLVKNINNPIGKRRDDLIRFLKDSGIEAKHIAKLFNLTRSGVYVSLKRTSS